MTASLTQIQEQLDRMERLLTPEARSKAEEAAHARGLLSYEDLQDRLTVGRKKVRRPCMRTVREIVARHRKIIRPVEIGHTLVGFREANVERLISHLSGEETGGGL